MIALKPDYLRVLAFWAVSLCCSLIVHAQELASVSVRLNNPQFEAASRTLSLDVELQSETSNEQLFGINVRFFYDAEKLDFQFIDNLAEGYQILGDLPVAKVGNASSGMALFNLERTAAFVNGAVQLMAPVTAVTMQPGSWTKYFRLNFRVPAHWVQSEEGFYPSIILDCKGPSLGGFLPGDGGVVVTLCEQDPSTVVESKPSLVEVSHFNWLDQQQPEYPYGIPLEETGIDLNPGVVSATSGVVDDAKAIRLLQNFPNPFVASTQIGFILPESDRVTLRFFDISGRELGVISGFYEAGYHQVEVNKSRLLEAAEVILYRLEATDYTSGYRKMTWIGQ